LAHAADKVGFSVPDISVVGLQLNPAHFLTEMTIDPVVSASSDHPVMVAS
jgi:hypothetical protein